MLMTVLDDLDSFLFLFINLLFAYLFLHCLEWSWCLIYAISKKTKFVKIEVEKNNHDKAILIAKYKRKL